jgi:hypothetical protein
VPIQHGALSFLDVSNNQLGMLTVPPGWSTMIQPTGEHAGKQIFKAPEGEWTLEFPSDAKSEGIIAIKDMRAMSCANGGYFKACHCPQCVQLKQTTRCGHCGQHTDQHKPKVIP